MMDNLISFFFFFLYLKKSSDQIRFSDIAVFYLLDQVTVTVLHYHVRDEKLRVIFFHWYIAVKINELFTCMRKNFPTCRNSIEWTL